MSCYSAFCSKGFEECLRSGRIVLSLEVRWGEVQSVVRLTTVCIVVAFKEGEEKLKLRSW